MLGDVYKAFLLAINSLSLLYICSSDFYYAHCSMYRRRSALDNIQCTKNGVNFKRFISVLRFLKR